MKYKTHKIQCRIKELGLNQETVAEQISTDKENFSRIIRNCHKIFNLKTAQKIAELLNVGINEILTSELEIKGGKHILVPIESEKNVKNHFENLYLEEKENRTHIQIQLTDALIVIQTQCETINLLMGNTKSMRK